MTGKAGPLYLKPHDARDMGTLLDDFRSGKLGRQMVEDEPTRRALKGFVSETVMLLEDLRSTAFIARAEKLSVDVSQYTLDVVIIGYTTSSQATFELLVDEVPKTVSLEATAEEFKEQTGVTGVVTLGAQTVPGDRSDVLLAPSRWRISWPAGDVMHIPPEDSQRLTPGVGGTNWFTRVEQTLTVGTGQFLEVIQTIPTGWDTPLRAGSICEVVRGKGRYWKVIGAEARLWNSIGTMGVQP